MLQLVAAVDLVEQWQACWSEIDALDFLDTTS